MKRVFKSAMLVAFFFAVILPLSDLIFEGRWNWIRCASGIGFGFVVGVLYALLTRATMTNMANSVEPDVAPDERRIIESSSTLIKGKAGFPGRLVLTDKKLVFKSKKIRDKDFQEEIMLSSIQSADGRNFWYTPGHDLMIATNDGAAYRFIVYAPEEWISHIRQLAR